MQVLRRVVADLFELQQKSQHLAAALNAITFSNLAHGVLNNRFIKSCLFFAQVAIFLHFNLVRQVLDDIRVRFETPQDKR